MDTLAHGIYRVTGTRRNACRVLGYSYRWTRCRARSCQLRSLRSCQKGFAKSTVLGFRALYAGYMSRAVLQNGWIVDSTINMHVAVRGD